MWVVIVLPSFFASTPGGTPPKMRTPHHEREWNTKLKEWRIARKRAEKEHGWGRRMRAVIFLMLFFMAGVVVHFFVLDLTPGEFIEESALQPVYGLIDWQVMASCVSQRECVGLPCVCMLTTGGWAIQFTCADCIGMGVSADDYHHAHHSLANAWSAAAGRPN